jgi:FkbM family methyltransferase
MNIARDLFTKTLVYHLYQEAAHRYHWKYVLPKIQEIELEGLKFDVSQLSPKIRNRLLSGAYEAYEKQMCRDFLTKDDAVIELGAAIGFIGMICQKQIGITDYASFEANPKTAGILKRNYELNGLKPNAWVVALGCSDGQVDLEIGTDFWENSIVTPDPQKGSHTVRVDCGTMETLLKRCGVTPNVLIIDIEGAEQFIDFNALPATVNKVIMELHPGVIGQAAVYDIVAALINRGFRVAREQNQTFAFLRK